MAFLLIVLVGYLAWLIGIVVYAWRQDTQPTPNTSGSQATILFAFKNEEKALPAFLHSLLQLAGSWPHRVGVDDGSTDASVALLQAAREVQLVRYVGPSGKRPALAAALQVVETPFVLQTDADCILPSGWALSSLQVLAQQNADVAIFPIKFKEPSQKSFWTAVLDIELASVMATTCATARAGKPVMCNGANLGYKHNFWQEAAPSLAALPYVGGDDMFLLDYATAHRKKISYCDAPSVWVETDAPTSLRAFLAQRRRWAAKWPGYTSPWPVAIAGLSLAGQVAFAALAVAAMSGFGTGVLWLALGLKVFLEGLLLSRQLQKINKPLQLIPFLFWQLAYLPYVLAVAIPALYKPKSRIWKR